MRHGPNEPLEHPYEESDLNLRKGINGLKKISNSRCGFNTVGTDIQLRAFLLHCCLYLNCEHARPGMIPSTPIKNEDGLVYRLLWLLHMLFLFYMLQLYFCKVSQCNDMSCTEKLPFFIAAQFCEKQISTFPKSVSLASG